MKAGPLPRVFGVALLSAAMAVPAAEVVAQVVPGAVGQPQQRDERPDERSPAVREF